MRPRIILICAALVLACFCTDTSRAQTTTSDSRAQVLLKDMIAKYRAAKTYSDTGTTVSWLTWSADRKSSSSFGIRFARPSVRVDVVRPETRISIRNVWWSDPQSNHTWSSRGNRLQTSVPDDLYRSRWGVGSPAYYIPELLDTRFANRYFPQISKVMDFTMAADEVLEGVVCYHLTPKNAAATPGQSFDLYIGKDDLLIRKFGFSRGELAYQEIHRHVQLDGELPADTFRIAPPEE